MKKISRIIIGLFVVIGIIVIIMNLWNGYGIEKSNPNNYATIGDIPTPDGYERIEADDPEYGKFLRSLPLKPKGAVLKYYIGGIADLQELNYAVVDLPLLSNAEQCADVCMRLRAEYLYHAGRLSDIRFMDVQGKGHRGSVPLCPGKPHKDVLKAIRTMEPAWEKECGRNFSLTSEKVKMPQGGVRLIPVFQLTKTESLKTQRNRPCCVSE